MAYKSVWWHPNYVEYGSGVKDQKTWLTVQDQYRRPHALYDLRHYDVPTEECEAMLYHRLPRLGKPVYRATFRDKPHTVARHYPEYDPTGKAVGFHGRVYKEYGPTQFKYQGPYKDDLYWLEREPYLPKFSPQRPTSSESGASTVRGTVPEEKAAGKPSVRGPDDGMEELRRLKMGV